MVIEVLKQELAVDSPQRAEIIGQDCPRHAAVSYGPDHFRLQEANLFGQGDVRSTSWRGQYGV